MRNARDLLKLLTERYPPPTGRHHGLWFSEDGKLHLMLHIGDDQQDIVFDGDDDLTKDPNVAAGEIEALNPRAQEMIGRTIVAPPKQHPYCKDCDAPLDIQHERGAVVFLHPEPTGCHPKGTIIGALGYEMRDVQRTMVHLRLARE